MLYCGLEYAAKPRFFVGTGKKVLTAEDDCKRRKPQKKKGKSGCRNGKAYVLYA